MKTGIIFTHFFYILLVLAAIWWKRKGLVVPVFLAFILILSDFFSPLKANAIFEDFFRMLIFIFVGIIVVILSERIEKFIQKLEASEEKYQFLIESAGDPISVVDKDGVILLANSYGAEMMDMNVQDLVGKTLWDVFPESADLQMVIIREVMQNKKVVDVELPIKYGEEVMWFSTSIQPMILII
ncbi:MAG: PAS domain-containing protein [Methanobacteriaceae archaeon]|nr:PAS domain-containing protein [Methanobacteriaceae archaeon]